MNYFLSIFPNLGGIHFDRIHAAHEYRKKSRRIIYVLVSCQGGFFSGNTEFLEFAVIFQQMAFSSEDKFDMLGSNDVCWLNVEATCWPS